MAGVTATEVWFRNPDLYIRECVELGASQIAWDRGYLVKKSIDPVRLAELHFASHVDYRLLLVGEQGTAELRRGSTLGSPVAVYPTWDYETDTVLDLEEMLAHPAGNDDSLLGNSKLPVDEKPVRGQEHRVVVIRFPSFHAGAGRKFIRLLRELQSEYPDAIVHPHGLYSYRAMFGLGFRSVDVDPRTTAKKGKVMLPSGKEVTFELAARTPQWVTLLGYKPVDLTVPRNRCLFNMKSAQWAAEHFSENLKFKSKGTHDVDPDEKTATPATTNAVKSKAATATVGDKFLCDTCSLQNTCKYFRAGEVCSIPGSEPASLARLFQTRDPDTIIEGLGTVLAAQTRRVERGMEDEQEYGELSPEVTKILNGIFEHGVKLAKLLAPGRFNAGKGVHVNVGAGGAALVGQAATPSAMVAGIVAELEARGIPRDKITPELLEGLLNPDRDVLDVPALEVGAGGGD